MNKISKYSKIFNIGSNIIVYNTINASIVALPESYFVSANILHSDIPPYELSLLKERGVIEGYIDMKQIEEDYTKFNTLIISLETLLSCNLSCPYCYQITNNTRKGAISTNNLDLLYEYIVKVYERTKYRTLIFKVLGGEPTVNIERAQYIIEKLSRFCKLNNIFFKLKIDTNGTIIKDLLLLNGYDSLLFTIPLTYKDNHNSYRQYLSGKGTYDEIINNVVELHKSLRNITIVLRYNVDSLNISKFRNYIHDLKSKLTFRPIIDAQYTTNPEYGNYENQLSYTDFVKWRSTDFIDILVENNYKVNISPNTLIGKCQYWSKYSIKVFSDGKVGACAMNFFDKENPTLLEILTNLDNLEKYWNNAKNFSLFSNLRCRNCSSLFLCGGAYNLPCVKDWKIKECVPEENLYINLNLFLERYIKYYCEGKKGLFIGMDKSERIR